MKASSLFLGFVVSSALTFTACSKDDNNPNPGTTDFNPATTGSNWTYKYTENGSADTFKLTATANSKDFNGRSYKIYTTDGGDSAYMGKAGSDYYRFQSFPSLGINNYEELYLKDNAKVNDTWSSTTSITLPPFGAIPVTLTYTVKGVGESHPVLTKTYSDVTHVRLDIAALGVPTGGGDFYYGKGIGMVDAQITVTDPSGGPGYTSTQQLLEYEVK